MEFQMEGAPMGLVCIMATTMCFFCCVGIGQIVAWAILLSIKNKNVTTY